MSRPAEVARYLLEEMPAGAEGEVLLTILALRWPGLTVAELVFAIRTAALCSLGDALVLAADAAREGA